MRKIKTPGYLIALPIAICLSTYAQDQKAAIEQKLESQYALTQPTADKTDIVTAGAILVLNTKKGKDNGIIMSPVSSTNPYQNTYKDGKITQNALGKGLGVLDRAKHLGASGSAPATRTFVPGEKMWVTNITAKPDGVIFELFTDAYADVRYKAALKFQFAKGTMPSVDQVEKLVAEVFKVQPAEDKNAQQQQAPAGGQEQPAPAPATADAPTPPVTQAAPLPPQGGPPATKEVSLGQTPDQVVAILGPPGRVLNGRDNKQIYSYKDLKITFTNGQVSDIQ
jgi:hypothetical protein